MVAMVMHAPQGSAITQCGKRLGLFGCDQYWMSVTIPADQLSVRPSVRATRLPMSGSSAKLEFPSAPGKTYPCDGNDLDPMRKWNITYEWYGNATIRGYISRVDAPSDLLYTSQIDLCDSP
jgi:hypothetical protein